MNKHDFATDYLKLKNHKYKEYIFAIHAWREGRISTHDLGKLTGKRYREAIKAGYSLYPMEEVRRQHLDAFRDELPNINDPTDQDFLNGWDEGAKEA